MSRYSMHDARRQRSSPLRRRRARGRCAEGRLQVLLQAGRLHLPITTEAAALIRELADYQITVNERAHASFTASSGKHDDLVIALGLSVGPGRRHRGEVYVGLWLPQPDPDDWRHPDHVPPWFDGTRLRGAR